MPQIRSLATSQTSPVVWNVWLALLIAGVLGAQTNTPQASSAETSRAHAAPASPGSTAGSLGVFEGNVDVGTVVHKGAATFDSAKSTYTVSGSGDNMWAARDAFHFVWKKVPSGDSAISAAMSVLGEGGDPHRKAVLMFRQDLDADSAYVDAALHGDGLTSLQFRDAKGAATHEVQANVSMPKKLRLVKRGNDFSLYVSKDGAAFELSGAAIRVALKGPFYVGIGVCAHNKDNVERASFSELEIAAVPAASSTAQPALHSTLETITVSSTDRRVVYTVPGRVEAPNWTPDGKFLIVNSNGRLQKVGVAGGTPETIDTGFAIRLNNDHGISPDGKTMAISDQSQEDRRSRIYVVPIEGGTPKLVTPKAPSYWHGWSPDGKTLAYCAERGGEFDVYTIPVEGGEETRLTTAKGLDDGPEYSPDGQYIYFNSDRTGMMQLWRMKPDGSAQEQLTTDEYNNWFPHPSPDGKLLVFLSYEKDVTGHPANKDVMLRIMSLADKKIRVLTKLFGGQGTINVPSWSPDSRRLSFVSYQLLPQ